MSVLPLDRCLFRSSGLQQLPVSARKLGTPRKANMKAA